MPAQPGGLKRNSRELSFLLAGIVIIAFSTLFVHRFSPLLSAILNILGLLIGGVPGVWMLYRRHTAIKEMEERFVELMRDITDSIESGMTLPLALEHTAKRDYGHLSRHVNALASQVNWGIPFEKALIAFAKKTGSHIIARAVDSIIEIYKVGGKISSTLTAVAASLQVIEKIKSERASAARAQLVTIYVIFAIFIAIMIMMQLFLLPQLPSLGAAFSPAFLTGSFAAFILLQGFFAGLAAGKLAENSFSAGLKHALIYMIGGYGAFILIIELVPLFTGG